MSAMVRAVVSTIATSVSSSGTRMAFASRRPIVDLPEPGMPTRTAFGAIGYPETPAAADGAERSVTGS